MSSLYAHVNQDACIACGLCQMLAPTLFDYDAQGIASFTLDHNTGTHLLSQEEATAFKQAFIRCPTGAIEHHDQPLTP